MAELSPQQDAHPGLDESMPAHHLSHPIGDGSFHLLGALLVLVALFASAWYVTERYNALHASGEQVDAEWSQALKQYNRRADLVPNLVAVVRSYAGNEKALFAELAHAQLNVAALAAASTRSRDPRVFAQFQEAQQRLSAPLSRLRAVSDSYPELKSNELYRDLVLQLEDSERHIAAARLRYGGAVTNYNIGIRAFPGQLLALSAGMLPRPGLDADATLAIAPPPTADLE